MRMRHHALATHTQLEIVAQFSTTPTSGASSALWGHAWPNMGISPHVAHGSAQVCYWRVDSWTRGDARWAPKEGEDICPWYRERERRRRRHT